MTQALRVFRDLRIAPEDTTGNGTKEDTATQRLIGTFSCPMGGKILHRPVEEYGGLGVPRRTIIIGEDLPMTFEGDAIFDQLHIIGQSIKSVYTPVAAGGSLLRWDFSHAIQSATTPKSLTFQFGDNLEQWDVEYCIARVIELIYAMNESVKVRAEYFGRNFEETDWNPAAGSMTTMSVLETALSNKTKFYSDSDVGSVGTNEVSASLLSGLIRIEPGYRPLKYGSALNYFDALIQGEPKLTFTGKFLWNTSLETHRGYYAAGTRRLYSLVTSGTGNRSIHVLFAGVITDFSAVGEEEGAATVDITIEAEYSTVGALLWMLRIFNLQTNLDTINP